MLFRSIRMTGIRDALTVGLLCAIPYGVGAALMLPISRHSDRYLERRLHLFWVAGAAGLGLLELREERRHKVLRLLAVVVVQVLQQTTQVGIRDNSRCWHGVLPSRKRVIESPPIRGQMPTHHSWHHPHSEWGA